MCVYIYIYILYIDNLPGLFAPSTP